MGSVLEHRREYLRLMRQFTQDAGYFTVTDLQKAAGIPRSTAQDWIMRLVREGCVVIRQEKTGRQPARFAAFSSIPQTTCRRIFTTTDGNRVEIFHECLSGSCAAFCGFHHAKARGVLTGVERDGTLLRECAKTGQVPVAIGLLPLPAVGVCGVELSGDYVIQHIHCIGGPAYSLTDMMSRAEGVVKIEVDRSGGIVRGRVWTKALAHVTIGIDNTDSKEGGATFALALALLMRLTAGKMVQPISHHAVMLNEAIKDKTAGNSASYIELAVPPSGIDRVITKSREFIGDESLSPEWGIAVYSGITIPAHLREYGRKTRECIVSLGEAQTVAHDSGAVLYGGKGVIGALGAVALARLPFEIQLDPSQKIA